jgi:hypothetical protein
MARLHRLLVLFVCGTLLVLPALGRGKHKNKEERLIEKEQQAEEKNAARYEKVKEFALNKYKTDPDFRDKVDSHLLAEMRKHSDEAFATNRNSTSRLVRVREDSWREHPQLGLGPDGNRYLTLYDNPAVQDYINRTGQKLVPPDSEKLYAFRVVADPVPLARSLATGTIYVSTGMIALVQSEAQLAYVLAHEMAHVHLDHWKERSMITLGEEEYNKSQVKKAGRIALIGAVAGGALGGGIGQSASTAAGGAAAGALSGLIAGLIINPTVKHIEWDKVQEDQADEMAFKAVLNRRYDVREVPRLYAAIDKVATRDQRVQLGFLGERKRVKLRLAKAEDLIQNAYKADIAVKERDGFVSSSAEHRNLMAELKRDNGILSFYHDMFETARANLADAVAIRDNDGAAQYFYGKTLKVIGRTDDDARLAKECFYKAAKADGKDAQNYGAHLHLALMLMRENGIDPKQITQELQTYSDAYGQWGAERRIEEYYPPNLAAIQDYMRLYGGDPDWHPKPPSTERLEQFRRVLALGPPDSETVAVQASSVPEPQPKPAASSIDQVKNAAAQAVPGAAVVPTVKRK